MVRKSKFPRKFPFKFFSDNMKTTMKKVATKGLKIVDTAVNTVKAVTSENREFSLGTQLGPIRAVLTIETGPSDLKSVDKCFQKLSVKQNSPRKPKQPTNSRLTSRTGNRHKKSVLPSAWRSTQNNRILQLGIQAVNPLSSGKQNQRRTRRVSEHTYGASDVVPTVVETSGTQ